MRSRRVCCEWARIRACRSSVRLLGSCGLEGEEGGSDRKIALVRWAHFGLVVGRWTEPHAPW